MKPKMKVFISGAITGHAPDLVKAKFEYASEAIKELGYIPISPLDNGLPADALWYEHMAKDLQMIESCDAICMLPCWETSTGAQIEYLFASEKGKFILACPGLDKPKLNFDERVFAAVAGILDDEEVKESGLAGDILATAFGQLTGNFDEFQTALSFGYNEWIK